MQSLSGSKWSVIESERADWCRLALSYTGDNPKSSAITVCRSGGRSLQVAALIRVAGGPEVYSCEGGATDIIQLLAAQQG